MSEPDEQESPFRQPTSGEQRAGLGCVIGAVVLLFLLIAVGILIGLT